MSLTHLCTQLSTLHSATGSDKFACGRVWCFSVGPWSEILIPYYIGMKTGSHGVAGSALLEVEHLSWFCHVVRCLLAESSSWQGKANKVSFKVMCLLNIF